MPKLTKSSRNPRVSATAGAPRANRTQSTNGHPSPRRARRELGSIKDLSPPLHRIYLAVYAERKKLSQQNRVAIITNLMARMRESWRVVGITRAALEVFRQNSFRNRSRSGITRAHIKMSRSEMVNHVLNRDEPLSEREFIRFWTENDVTVVCARGENSTPFDVPFIGISNADGELFQSNPLAGFRVAEPERSLMRSLLASHG